MGGSHLSLTLPLAKPAPRAVPATDRLVDSFGRRHNNLRLSVTDRCNLRCTYCMPEEVAFLDKGELLTFEEMTRFVHAAVPLGIDKVRLTGGEPLLRRELPVLVEMLAAIPGLVDLGLTTNGLLLENLAEPLYKAGLRRLNLSLDTLNPATFRQLTRRDGLQQVLAGIAAAQAAGFHPIKVNAVSIRGITEQETLPLARFARDQGLELRFIEYMPIGAEAWERSKVYFAHEIHQQLEEEFGPLLPAADFDPKNPAMDFDYGDGGGRVGFIASISRPFCHSCNRLRLTAEGKLRHCLFALDEIDVRPLLRSQTDAAELQACLRASVASKWEGHEINTARFIKPQRTMHSIGG